MTHAEQASNEYVVSINNLAQEAYVHFDEYFNEIILTDAVKAAKISSMSALCKQLHAIAETLK